MNINGVLMENETIVISKALILGEKIKKDSILIENDKIVEISDKISYKDADTVIDGYNKLVIPGLVNSHTHLSMTLMRGLADDIPLNKWLNNYIWPLEAKLTGEHCYAGALLGCVEMIKSGTTTFNDMYFFMDEVAKAVDKAGLRCLLSHGMIDLGNGEKREKEFKESKRIIKKCHNTSNGRIKVALGPHTPYTCSKELLMWVRKNADKYGVNIHIHVGETLNEVEKIMNLYGSRPFEYLDSIKFLKEDVIAAHAVWLSDDEIEIIDRRNTKISHNPVSNMKLASGIAPVSKMINEGISLSLGTDSAASNNNLDMFEEMKIAALLQKLNENDPTVLPAEKVFKMATIGGASALGLDSDIGTIEVGKKADIVLIDIKSANLTPFRNPYSHIVYSANGPDVDSVICDGTLLMKNKELQTLDEVEVIEIAENSAEDLISKR
jgi:5-methylthioadenosine/S-adenosylhomocysteine deaminase